MADDADLFLNAQDRLIDMREGLGRAESPVVPPPGDLMAVRVFNGGAMPASVPGVFATHPVALGGPEAAGSAGTAAADATRAEVTVLGPKVPAVGDVLLARRVGGRWVADRTGAAYGGGKVGVPGCPCLMPTSATMSVTDPTADFGMFQNTTLVYGAPPAVILSEGYAGGNDYFSPSDFFDAPTVSRFYYRAFCSSGFFCVSRVFYNYAGSGSFFSEAIRFRWQFGTSGNTCNPLLLVFGTVFPGGTTSHNGITVTE